MSETMKALTLWRGPIAIHATKVWGPTQKAAAKRLSGIIAKPADDLSRGFVVCVAKLINCMEMTEVLIEATPALE